MSKDFAKTGLSITTVLMVGFLFIGRTHYAGYFSFWRIKENEVKVEFADLLWPHNSTLLLLVTAALIYVTHRYWWWPDKNPAEYQLAYPWGEKAFFLLVHIAALIGTLVVAVLHWPQAFVSMPGGAALGYWAAVIMERTPNLPSRVRRFGLIVCAVVVHAWWMGRIDGSEVDSLMTIKTKTQKDEVVLTRIYISSQGVYGKPLDTNDKSYVFIPMHDLIAVKTRTK